VTKPSPFDPYALFEALDRNRVSYVVVGGFARVVHGSGEITGELDIVPSLREENLRRLARALEELHPSGTTDTPLTADGLAGEEPIIVPTAAGTLTVVPRPWGTRGYDDLRIRANRENLGRGIRPQIGSVVDLARTLEASTRVEDAERLHRLRRLMELERQLTHRRGLTLEL
jgi:hypothetical protein